MFYLNSKKMLTSESKIYKLIWLISTPPLKKLNSSFSAKYEKRMSFLYIKCSYNTNFYTQTNWSPHHTTNMCPESLWFRLPIFCIRITYVKENVIFECFASSTSQHQSSLPHRQSHPCFTKKQISIWNGNISIRGLMMKILAIDLSSYHLEIYKVCRFAGSAFSRSLGFTQKHCFTCEIQRIVHGLQLLFPTFWIIYESCIERTDCIFETIHKSI